MFKRFDTTAPVKSFVINQLIKNNKIMMYDGLMLTHLEQELKRIFKEKMDRWIYKKTNWLDVSECVKEEIYELKKLQE